MRRISPLPAVAALLACVLAARPCVVDADTIELTNGRTVEGVVLEERDDRIVVLTQQGARLNLKRGDVAAIIGTAGADPVAGRLDVFLQSGAMVEALALVEAQLAPDAPEPPTCARRLAIADVLVRREARLDDFLLREKGGRAARLVALLAALVAPWDLPAGEAAAAGAPCPAPPEDLLALLRYDVMVAHLVWLRAGDADATLARLRRPDAATFARPEAEAERIRAADLLLELVWHLQRLRRDEDAASALALLGRVDARAWRAAGAVFHLRLGAVHRQRGDYARALALYDVELRAFAPHHADLRLRETLDEAERVLAAGAQWTLLLDLLDRYGSRVDPAGAVARIRRAHELAGTDALDRGDIDAASSHFAAYRRLQGDGAERLLLLTEIARQRAALAPDDTFGTYQLAKRYMEEGLLDEAEGLFLSLAEEPEFSAAVAGQLAYLRDLREVRLHELANEALRAGRFYDTLDYTTQFAERFPDSRILDKVRRLADTARAEIGNERVRRPLEAKVLFENAERAYFLGDYPAALADLDRVLVEYADTTWAGQAERLKRQTLDAVYARGFEDYIRQRRLERGTLDRFLGTGEAAAGAAADVPAGVREEIHFIVATIGSRLPDDAFGGAPAGSAGAVDPAVTPPSGSAAPAAPPR